MHISFSPQRRDDALSVTKSGDILTINGEVFDFTSLPEGASLPPEAVPSEWVCGEVSRHSGSLHLTLVLPHGPNPSASVAFPGPLVNPSDGILTLPHDVSEAEHG